MYLATKAISTDFKNKEFQDTFSDQFVIKLETNSLKVSKEILTDS